MLVSLTALTARESFDGQGAVRPCSLPLVFAAYAYLAASAENEQEASWSARSPLLFMCSALAALEGLVLRELREAYFRDHGRPAEAQIRVLGARDDCMMYLSHV